MAVEFGIARIFGLIGLVLAIVIVVKVGATTIDDIAKGTKQLNENLTKSSVSFGDSTTDSIKPVFAIVIGLSILLGFVSAILAFT